MWLPPAVCGLHSAAIVLDAVSGSSSTWPYDARMGKKLGIMSSFSPVGLPRRCTSTSRRPGSILRRVNIPPKHHKSSRTANSSGVLRKEGDHHYSTEVTTSNTFSFLLGAYYSQGTTNTTCSCNSVDSRTVFAMRRSVFTHLHRMIAVDFQRICALHPLFAERRHLRAQTKHKQSKHKHSNWTLICR